MSKDNILPVLREEAQNFFLANLKKNKYATEERKYQAELDYLMSDLYEEVEGGFEHTFSYGGKEIEIEVKYEQRLTEVVDVRKFFEEVDLDTFLRCCTVTKTAAEKVVGRNIVSRCLATKSSEFKTRVREVK